MLQLFSEFLMHSMNTMEFDTDIMSTSRNRTVAYFKQSAPIILNA